MSTLLDVWRNVNRRIGFYTKATSADIPEEGGIYAWFLPLWPYSDDIDTFVDIVSRVFLVDYGDPSTSGKPERHRDVPFGWETVGLTIEKKSIARVTDEDRNAWNAIQRDAHSKAAFARSLMEATILTRPLYVGKADNLRKRYGEHIGMSYGDSNVFAKRFNECAQARDQRLRVCDLLFVCIKTDAANRQRLSNDPALNKLLESLLKRFASPPYSVR